MSFHIIHLVAIAMNRHLSRQRRRFVPERCRRDTNRRPVRIFGLQLLVALQLFLLLAPSYAEVSKQVAEEVLRSAGALGSDKGKESQVLDADVVCNGHAKAGVIEEADFCKEFLSHLATIEKHFNHPDARAVLVESFSKHFDASHLPAVMSVYSGTRTKWGNPISLQLEVPPAQPSAEPLEGNTFALSPMRSMRIARISELQEWPSQFAKMMVYAMLLKNFSELPSDQAKIAVRRVRGIVRKIEASVPEGAKAFEPVTTVILSFSLMSTSDRELEMGEQFLASEAGRHFVKALIRAQDDVFAFALTEAARRQIK